MKRVIWRWVGKEKFFGRNRCELHIQHLGIWEAIVIREGKSVFRVHRIQTPRGQVGTFVTVKEAMECAKGIMVERYVKAYAGVTE